MLIVVMIFENMFFCMLSVDDLLMVCVRLFSSGFVRLIRLWDCDVMCVRWVNFGLSW